MSRFARSGLTALALASAAAASAATPPNVFGTAVYLTSRGCNGIAATENCLGETNPNIGIVQGVFDGGASMSSHAVLSPTLGGFDQAAVTYGDLDLPFIRAQAYAGDDNRNNTNSYGYQSYVYTGDAITPFALTATLNFTSSGAPVTAALGPDDLPNEVAGEGYSFIRFGIMDPAVIAALGLTSAEDIFQYGFGQTCGDAGIYGTAESVFASPTSGAGGGSLTLSGGCDGNPIMLTPGQQLLVFLLEQTPTNRGGYFDAYHTLSLSLADTLTTEQQAALSGGLVSALSVVPEPSSWALMIGGFGMIGAVMRHRKTLLDASARYVP